MSEWLRAAAALAAVQSDAGGVPAAEGRERGREEEEMVMRCDRWPLLPRLHSAWLWLWHPLRHAKVLRFGAGRRERLRGIEISNGTDLQGRGGHLFLSVCSCLKEERK